MSDPAHQIASNTVHYLASPNTPLLENLMIYHKHQTRLLCDIFAKIDKHRVLDLIIDDNTFVGDVQLIERYIQRLGRTLRGGQLTAWFRAKESQDELTQILCLLAPYKKKEELDEAKFRKRVREATKKDHADRKAKMDKLVKKFENDRPRFFQRAVDLESCFGELLPEFKKLSGHGQLDRLLAIQYLLDQFPTTGITSATSFMAPLMDALNTHITAKLSQSPATAVAEATAAFVPPDVRIIRRPSGSIIAILLGKQDRDEIHQTYCPEIQGLRELPVLYTSKTHEQCRRQFAVAQKAIQRWPDSPRYVMWTKGPAPSTDIYLVEKNGKDAFILATRLGHEQDATKDVTITLAREGLTVRDAIRFLGEQEWISQDGWEEYGMDGLRCNDQRFKDYAHQIFVPGPHRPAAASSVVL
ncbi:hypothetical protein FB45DRAFT_931782 [Roridomyces roridus]|uniref:Uncharacterized protein n=1 Tax=Roridomyces roridus TaxID=1738132 RepID=A0AAD7BEC3_9AGAR|nr:hypothetical protein FB45DRAFT_931782 [Roridomyces roridus]